MTVGGSVTPKVTCTSSDPVGLQSSCDSPTPKAILLHEGYYHLVVLTDGAPVTITLRLHGAHQRKAAVKLQRSVRTLEANLPERESVGSSTITYGTDVPIRISDPGVHADQSPLHPKAELLAATTCARADSGAPPAYAFSPPCPGAAASATRGRSAAGLCPTRMRVSASSG